MAIENKIKKIVAEVCCPIEPDSITLEHNLMRDLGADYVKCKEIQEQIEVCLGDEDIEIIINTETNISDLVKQVKIYC